MWHSQGKLSKHILAWLKAHGQILSLEKGTRKRIFFDQIKAGDVVLFSYPIVFKNLSRPSPNQPFIRRKSTNNIGGEYRIAFVVNTGPVRTDGMFHASTGNLLLSVFKLSSSPVVNKIVLGAFYRRRLVNYQSFIRVLGTIYGKEAFRTYKLYQTRDLQILKFDLRKLRTKDEDDE